MRDEKKGNESNDMQSVLTQLNEAHRQVEVAERARESETKKKNMEIKK